MSVSQWDNFTNYVVGDQVQNNSAVIYTCILANINQPPPNATYWSVNPSGAGIQSINSQTGPAINIGGASPIGVFAGGTPNIINVGIRAATVGIYTQVEGGSATTVIPALGCSLTSQVILATYIHAGGGGGSQYIMSLAPAIPSAGFFTMTTNTPMDAGDQVNWFVIQGY
jgi:hypothetical protein